ncbi:hypothetical protein MTR67_015547 [Solanum verrucosum]|uniref:Reverse transcriptase domain-containing protein n=1 Tax=Solanum verrucosum TaxID=315347 RepID=A0AAF0TIV0_SOLVR|nr:hypothetical protein MTR67_015547 [Solanum verrucosum]
MDAVLIANEAVDSSTKQKKPGILCTLDIEKAYDHVNWKYLMKILERMGFGQKWMNWIMFCISTINFYVLINGLPAGFFSSQRGLRQGFDVSRDGAESLEVTHLQYVDDTLIFCGAEEEQLKYLRVILVLFEGVSGLHINWRKSFMYPINEVNNMSYIASILGGVVGTLPTTYLGMPLGAKSKSIEIWNGVIEKCEKKLARWKTQYLSMGGRLTLINSVLNALPTYMMSLFPIPARVIKKLDRIRRNFLWQGNNEKKRFHLVKWESVVTGKKNGGLGIKNLIFQSEALRMKWLWRYSFEDQLMWKRVVGAKYEAEDSWMTKDVTSPYGVSLWRSIRELWEEVKLNSKVKVGNGNKTKFWKDKWHESGNLELLFPDIYNLVLSQQRTIAEIWTTQGWNFQFRRHLNDWEVMRVAEFLNIVGNFNGLQAEEDALWWKGSSKGIFKVGATYRLMEQPSQQIPTWP